MISSPQVINLISLRPVWQLFRTNNNILLGRQGERIVVNLLARNLYYIWDINWTHKIGELDIIAQHGRDLHFIEVKTRNDHGESDFTPEMAVDIYKTERLRLLADMYIYQNEKLIKRHKIKSLQFDIAAVGVRNYYLVTRAQVDFYANAFSFESN